jgi:maltose alpha-D-glucosyltransferase/alpha-amylase
MLQQQVPSRGSAWERALEDVQSYAERAALEQRRLADRGEATPTPAGVETALGTYRATADLIGRRTADLHRTLAGIEGDGFGVHPLDQHRLEVISHDMKAEAGRVLDLAAAQRDKLPESAQAIIDRLFARRSDILSRFDRVATLKDAGQRIRIHGDFHLGQILSVDGDVYFIDFEGEPIRPIAERTQPQSPLRDVAGVMRSFSYAARAGFKVFHRSEAESRPSLEPWVHAWESDASAIFLDSYLKRMGDGPLLPGAASRQALLEAFILEKALYELAYELGNRPDWVDIPLAGLLQLVDPAAVAAAAAQT